MNTFTKVCVLLLSVTFFGCAMGNRFDPLSPRNRNQVKNDHGKIEEMKTNQDAITADMLKLRQEQEITARDMKEVQTGQFNKQNTGVQIFQGDGALITVIILFGMILAAGVMAAHYRAIAHTQTKISDILAKSIVKHNDEELTESVCDAAVNSDVGPHIYSLLNKHQRMFN